MYDSERIIEMIKSGSDSKDYLEALTIIYKQHKTDFHLRLKKGKYQLPNEVVQDIYHQSIVILVRKIQQNKISDPNIPAYLWGICQNLFLQYRDKSVRGQINKDKYNNENNHKVVTPKAEDKLLDDAYRKIADQIFNKIGEKCRKVLLWRQMKFSYREIAYKLNPGNPPSDRIIRVLASRCKKKMIQLIKENPELKKQIDELLM